MHKKALTSRVIVFCGGVGTGKTTCVNILNEFLKKNKQPVFIVNPFKDLYLPFAKKQGYRLPAKNTRKDMTLLIKNLYRQYGQSLGSKLLIEFIKKNSNSVYILDGKRNPEGISYIKQTLRDRCLVIGVISDIKTRSKRINTRARDIDFNNLIKNTFSLIKNDENVYNISKSVCLSDFVICNSGVSTMKLRQILKPLSIRLLIPKTEKDSFAKAFWEKLLAMYKNTLPKRFLDLDEITFIRLINIIIDNQFNFKLVIILIREKINFNSEGSKIGLDKEISFIKFIFKEKIKNNVLLFNLIRFHKLYRAHFFADSLGVANILSDGIYFESTNECEVKFPLTLDIKNKVKTHIAKINILHRGILTFEDDLVIDTEAYDLKKRGILFRFRMFKKGRPVLFTIKFKKERGLIKHDIELQKTITENNMTFFNLVNDFLKAFNMSKINFKNLITVKNSDEIAKYFKHTIYRRVRMRIQKKRQVFRIKENETICLDVLPKDIGKFIEIESDSLENVKRIMRLIGLDQRLIIKEDYGEIVMSYNKLHNIKDERVAKFD